MKLFCGVMLTCWAVAALAGNNAPGPKEKVAEFVVEKLDVTNAAAGNSPQTGKGQKDVRRLRLRYPAG